MPFPILLLCGCKKSGKNTVSEALLKNYNAVSIALADPLKRFCKSIFNFSDLQLWGDSTNRDEIDIRYPAEFEYAKSRFYFNKLSFLYKIDQTSKNAMNSIDDWFDACYSTHSFSPRIALQLLGTEFGRNLNKNIWINIAIEIAKKLLSGGYDYSYDAGLIKSDNKGFDFVIITDGRFRNEILSILEIGGHTWRILRYPNPTEDNHASETEISNIPKHFFSKTLYNVDSIETLVFLSKQYVNSDLLNKS